jgi:hypothetical protein
MATRTRFASLFARIALAGLLSGVAAVGACTTVRRVPPVEYLNKNSPEVVWVTYTNNAVVPLAQPEIAGDTLKGLREGTSNPLTIPLDQVRSVQAKQPDHLKTALLVTTLGVGAVSAVYFIYIRQAGPFTDGVLCGYDVRVDPIPYC